MRCRLPSGRNLVCPWREAAAGLQGAAMGLGTGSRTRAEPQTRKGPGLAEGSAVAAWTF